MILRLDFIRDPTLTGGWGTSLDVSRQYIVDTGRLYTSNLYYSPWYFPRNVDHHIQIFDAMVCLLTGNLTPVSAARLLNTTYFPSILLILTVASWGRRFLVPSLQSRNAVTSRTLEIGSYFAFALFPTYTLVSMEFQSYAGYVALVFLLFFLTVLLRRLTIIRGSTAYIVVLVLAGFALFNMYHSTSLEVLLMIILVLVFSVAWKPARFATQTMVMIIALYTFVGVYQNLILINEPLVLIRYFADFRFTTDFALTTQVNAANLLGYPSTRWFGLANLLIIVGLIGWYLYFYVNKIRKKQERSRTEFLCFLLVLSAGAPLAVLFLYGGLYFLVARFREQVMVWVLLLVLPVLVAGVTKSRARAILTALIVVAVLTSISGQSVAQESVPQPDLSRSEFSVTQFVWTRLPETTYVFSDWPRGTALMYGHRYIFGPDPYKMEPRFFENLTQAMFYGNGTSNLNSLIASACGTDEYVLFVSQRMVNPGPLGPDHAYRPAVSDLFARIENDPDFNVVYSNGQAILAYPNNIFQ